MSNVFRSRVLLLKYACEARRAEETVIRKSRQKQNKLQNQSEADRRAAVNGNGLCRCGGNIRPGCFQSKEEPAPNMMQYHGYAHANSAFAVRFVQRA